MNPERHTIGKVKHIWETHPLLVICSVISIVLLVSFCALQMRDSPILNLNPQWIVVAGAPLLVALFAGGYIQKFKGFGLELEAKLQAPITSLDLNVADAITVMPGNEKQNITHLQTLSPQEIQNINRLSFVMNKKDYYDPHVVIRYFNKLENLEFIEVKRHTGQFVCLIPISAFKHGGEVNNHCERFGHDRVSKFITALEQNTILTDFSNVCISTTVKPSDTLMNVLKLLRMTNSDYAIVTSHEDMFIGIVTSRQIEKKIADDVLYTKTS